MRTYKPIFAAALFALGLSAGLAHATPITYEITLKTSHVFYPDRLDDRVIKHEPKIGDKFTMRLKIDDSLLKKEGSQEVGLVLSFKAQIDKNVWQLNKPGDATFRGPCEHWNRDCSDEEWDKWGLGSDYFGFSVSSGKITSLFGGVIGSEGDEPFIDFWGDHFTSLTYFEAEPVVGVDDPVAVVALNGSLEFRAIPEPTTFALFGIGALALMRRRTRS